MTEFLSESLSFGLILTLGTFWAAEILYKKTHFFLFNPLLVSSAMIIVVLVLFKIPYEKYLKSANILYYMMTPVTAALAIPLYQQFQSLKSNAVAILVGILSGILANGLFIFAMCWIFKIGHIEYISLLPKSITTPIGIAVTAQNGGIQSITVLMISIAGNVANIFAVMFCKLFRIKEPVAVGVSCGTSGHALATSKALEIGDVEGAISGLSIAVCGVLSVLILPFFVKLI